MFSGGIGSWAAAKRVRVEPGDSLILLFTDTLIEDPDLYRFLGQAAAKLLWSAERPGKSSATSAISGTREPTRARRSSSAKWPTAG